jgi:hypothetical protein
LIEYIVEGRGIGMGDDLLTKVGIMDAMSTTPMALRIYLLG